MEQPNTGERIAKLAKRVKAIETFLADMYEDFEPAQLETKAVQAVQPAVIQENTYHAEKLPPSGPSQAEKFIEWLKTDWLMKLGAFLLLLALGWFVTYAFVNNWIGPVGRIAIGILAGTGIMLGGHFAIPKKRSPGQVLVVLGGVMILLTIFAARTYYDFFSPASALPMMSLVVIAMAVIAILHNAKSVAILALLGGAFVPILASSGSDNYFILVCYILVLNLGTLVVATMRGWRSMITISLIITGLYSLTAFPGLEKKESIRMVWIFMALYYAFFFISNIAAIIKTRVANSADLVTSGMNGLLLLYWVYKFVPEESASLVLSGVVLLMIITNYILVKLKDLKSSLYIYAGLAVVFLGAATAFELEGAIQTIAFSVEAFIVVVLAKYALKESRFADAASLTQSLPTIMALPSIMDRSWTTGPLFNKDFFVILIVTLSLAGTAAVIKHRKSNDLLGSIYGIIAGLFTVALIWLSCHNIFNSVNTAKGVALVIYSIAGVATLFYGTYLQNKTQRIIGGILLGGVVIRLLFVEVWSMSLAGKIITFVAIGALLVSTAFFQKRISHPDK